jgi:putative ABC transport system permease protein
LQIVGVVKDSRQIASRQVRDLYDPVSPEIYVPFWQHPDGIHEMAVLMRSEKDPETFGDAARREVLGMDREQPIYDVQTLQALADVALGPARLCLLVLGIFAGTALLTACIGLYAIVSYSVTQRTHEIGIRVALGAKRSEVLRLVAADAMPVIGLGLGVGLLTSLGITRFMSSLLYGIPPNDLATLLGAALILTATATLAVYVPSRRAVSIDPMEALRYE